MDLDNGSCLAISEHTNISAEFLFIGSGSVFLGEHIVMGKECIFITPNHKYVENSYDAFEIKDIIVGNNVWFGHRVIVLPGVHICKHAILGADAVVAKDVPAKAIVAGNPKVIKSRGQKPDEI